MNKRREDTDERVLCLIETLESMVEILKDPYPGLATWCGSLCLLKDRLDHDFDSLWEKEKAS